MLSKEKPVLQQVKSIPKSRLPKQTQKTLPLACNALFSVLAFASGGSAYAQCAPLTPAADTVSCIGNLDGSVFNASAGDDVINIDTDVGLNGAATVSGGDDDDTITFNGGADIGVNIGSVGEVYGGAGIDVITLDGNTVGDLGFGIISGDAGDDTISLTNVVIAAQADSGATINGGADDDRMIFTDSDIAREDRVDIDAGAGDDFLSFNNSTIASSGLDGTAGVTAGLGNDTIQILDSTIGGGGPSRVTGGDGNDSITIARSNVIIFGGVHGGDGNDIFFISGNSNNSIRNINGGNDDDVFVLNANGSVEITDINGNDGDDRFEIFGGGPSISVLDGGDGFDSVHYNQEVIFNQGLPGVIDAGNYRNFERLRISTNSSSIAEINNTSNISSSFSELHIGGRVLIESTVDLDVSVSFGLLGGNGIINGDVVVGEAGSVNPGSQLDRFVRGRRLPIIGALTINGDVTFEPRSSLLFEFDSLSHDHLIVNGSVTLQGGYLNIFSEPDLPLPLRATTYELLTASEGIFGSFGRITPLQGFPATARFEQTANSLLVVIAPQLVINSQLSPDATHIANLVNTALASGGGSTTTDALLSFQFENDNDAAALNNGLLDLSPAAYPSIAAITAEQSLLSASIVRNHAMLSNNAQNGFHAWLSGASSFANYEENPDSSGFGVDTYSAVGGISYRRNKIILGAYGGYINSHQDFNALSAETNLDTMLIGAYGGWQDSNFSALASVSYAMGDTKTSRMSAFFDEQLTSMYDLNALTAQAYVQYQFSLFSFNIRPAIGMTYISVDHDNILESGGIAAIEIGEMSNDFLYTDVGVTASHSIFSRETVSIYAELDAGWRHEALGHSFSANGRFAGLDEFLITSTTPRFDRNRVIGGAGVKAVFKGGIEAHVRYDGELGSDYAKNQIIGGVSVPF